MVTIAGCFFAVGGEEIRPSGSHVTRKVIGDDRTRVETLREDGEELIVVELIKGVVSEGALAGEDLVPDGNGIGGEGRLICVIRHFLPLLIRLALCSVSSYTANEPFVSTVLQKFVNEY